MGRLVGGRRAPRFLRLLAPVFAGASFACDPGTRIEGTIRLAGGLEAPDDGRHTLYVAAFRTADSTAATFDTSAAPAFVEFGGIRNDDFDPEVEFALGGAGAAEELNLFVWWKVGAPELPDYEPPESGDRVGVHAENPVFPGADGTDGRTRRGVEITLDGDAP